MVKLGHEALRLLALQAVHLRRERPEIVAAGLHDVCQRGASALPQLGNHCASCSRRVAEVSGGLRVRHNEIANDDIAVWLVFVTLLVVP